MKLCVSMLWLVSYRFYFSYDYDLYDKKFPFTWQPSKSWDYKNHNKNIAITMHNLISCITK